MDKTLSDIALEEANNPDRPLDEAVYGLLKSMGEPPKLVCRECGGITEPIDDYFKCRDCEAEWVLTIHED